MASLMPDCRRLVPRTPPEGMKEWVMKTCAGELDRCGLLYEAEYVEDLDFACILDCHAKLRKTKMVRVTCSCCGASALLSWAHSKAHGYGFVLPDDEEGDWDHTVTEASDECRCPVCNTRVLVNKRAAVKDYYVTAEASCMSVSLVGKDRLLALTGWRVQRLTSKAGYDSLKIIPAEAYVFGPDGCAHLMGWRNGYSGQCGCFIQWERSWRQPGDWCDRWGNETDIFGLTPELVAASCLPHCKLDVYMDHLRGLSCRYPVSYLRLYQRHHNVEALLISGLPLVLSQMIHEEMLDSLRNESAGDIELDEINWNETRPAQMLGLTKDELKTARGQEWDLLFWRLFTRTKAAGEMLDSEDIQNAFQLGDDRVLSLIGRGPVGRSIRYLLRQCRELAAEVDDAGADDWIPDVSILLDYWDMSERLGRDLSDQSVRYPIDLLQAHDAMTELMKQRKLDALVTSFRLRRKQLKKYIFAADGLIIRPAASQAELTAEGDTLHHCVGSYGERHASGATAIFFVRRLSRPKEPYYTLELDEQKLDVRQNRGMRNCSRTPEVQAFEDKWLAWVRAGCQRDKLGKPVLPQEKKRGAA